MSFNKSMEKYEQKGQDPPKHSNTYALGRVEKQEFWIISNLQVDSAVRNKYKNFLLNR